MPDILFNCRACAQELVVDASGAGLTVPCPGCGIPVKVPAEGETGIIHREEDGLELRVSELEKALGAERTRARQAEATLDALAGRLQKREAESAKGAEENRRRQQEMKAREDSRQREAAVARERAQAVEKERDDLRAAHEAAQSERRAAQAEIQAAQAQADQKDEAARREARQAGERETEWKEKLAAAEADLHAARQARDDLAAERATFTEQEAEWRQTRRDLAAQADRLTVELSEARGALLRAETQLYHAMSAREGLAAMVHSLQKNLADASDLHDAMIRTVQALEAEVQRLQIKLSQGPGQSFVSSKTENPRPAAV